MGSYYLGQIFDRPVNDQNGRFIWPLRYIRPYHLHGLPPREFYTKFGRTTAIIKFPGAANKQRYYIYRPRSPGKPNDWGAGRFYFNVRFPESDSNQKLRQAGFILSSASSAFISGRNNDAGFPLI